MSGLNLITIGKFGESNLRIHPDALADHQRLGWRQVPDEPESEPEQTAKLSQKAKAPAASR